MFGLLSTVISVRMPSIRIPVFLPRVGQRDIGTAYRIIILISLALIIFIKKIDIIFFQQPNVNESVSTIKNKFKSAPYLN